MLYFADDKTAMARKKRTTVTKQLESPDCPLFELPGELRNAIYELVFKVDSEPVNIEDAFSPYADGTPNARPPSSALVRSCRKLHEETKRVFAAAYRKYWDKSFIVDLRRVDHLLDIIKYVPTAWIDKYILSVKTGTPNSTEVVLSRFGGGWHAKVTKTSNIILSNALISHTNTCIGWLRRNMLSDGYVKRWLQSGHTRFYTSPWEWIKSDVVAKSTKKIKRKFTRQKNNSKKKLKRKYKRPKDSVAVPMGGCRTRLPRPEPLTNIRRLHLLQSRMALSKGSAPLTGSELLRMLQPGMGIPVYLAPHEIKWDAQTLGVFLLEAT